jgi:hypothetical protein
MWITPKMTHLTLEREHFTDIQATKKACCRVLAPNPKPRERLITRPQKIPLSEPPHSKGRVLRKWMS